MKVYIIIISAPLYLSIHPSIHLKQLRCDAVLFDVMQQHCIQHQLENEEMTPRFWETLIPALAFCGKSFCIIIMPLER